jgi:hypothetical protein
VGCATSAVVGCVGGFAQAGRCAGIAGATPRFDNPGRADELAQSVGCAGVSGIAVFGLDQSVEAAGFSVVEAVLGADQSGVVGILSTGIAGACDQGSVGVAGAVACDDQS